MQIGSQSAKTVHANKGHTQRLCNFQHEYQACEEKAVIFFLQGNSSDQWPVVLKQMMLKWFDILGKQYTVKRLI